MEKGNILQNLYAFNQSYVMTFAPTNYPSHHFHMARPFRGRVLLVYTSTLLHCQGTDYGLQQCELDCQQNPTPVMINAVLKQQTFRIVHIPFK